MVCTNLGDTKTYNDVYKVGEWMDGFCTVDELMDFIAKRIQALREQKNVSAYSMSLELGQNNSYINKIENRKSNVSLEVLLYICQYFNITISDFFDTDIQYPIELQEHMKEATKLDKKALQNLTEIAKQLNER